MFRSRLMFASAAVALALTADLSGLPPNPELIVTIEGGFLHVFSDKTQRYEFGAMKSTPHPHPIHLRLGNATADVANLTKDSGRYNLSGHVIEITSPGTTLTGVPTLPKVSTLAAATAPTNWDNLYLIPDLVAIANKAAGEGSNVKLLEKWRDTLDARVILAGGKINVRKPAQLFAQNALWQFKQPGSRLIHEQSIADTLIYRVPIASRRVILKEGPATLLDLSATAGNLTFTITAETVKPYRPIKPGEAFQHFTTFFDAVSPSPARRPLPYYEPRAKRDDIVGKYCLGARATESAESGPGQ